MQHERMNIFDEFERQHEVQCPHCRAHQSIKGSIMGRIRELDHYMCRFCDFAFYLEADE